MKTRNANVSMKVCLKYVSGALLAFGAFSASGVDITWTGNAGDGEWLTQENWNPVRVPQAGDLAIFSAAGGALAVSDNCTIQRVRVNGPADVTLNIAADKTLLVSNTGGEGMLALGGNLTVNGPGLLGHTTAGGVNHLDDGANPGFTLAIHAQIVAPDGGADTGFETWVGNGAKGGTVILGCEANAFTLGIAAGNGHTICVSKLADLGQPSSIGAGNAFYPNRGSVLRYTGADDSTDWPVRLNGGDAVLGFGGGIEQDGTGILTWAGPIYNNSNNAQTLLLGGDSAHEGRVTGDIYNNVGTLAVRKYGSGTWVLAGDNTFTGSLAVEGGTLGLDSANATRNVAQITMADGTALSVNPSATDGFSAVVPQVFSPGSVTLTVADAPTDSSVTFNTLSAIRVAVIAPQAGTAFNRVFITGFPAGPVGAWLTLNGGAAEYDLTDGLKPLSTPLTTGRLDTKGNPLPDGATVRAVIDGIGTGNDIWAVNDPTALYSLTMDVAGDDATVDLGGKRLMLNRVAVNAGADALTLANGTLTAPLTPAATGGARISVIRTDAATGISPSKDYTHLLSFGSIAATVNGVTVPAANATSGTVTGSDGLGYGWLNAPGNAANQGTLAAGTTDPGSGGGLNDLIFSMRYSGGGSPSMVTLTDLTDGESYELTFFTRHWNDFNYSRLAHVTFITDGSGVPSAPVAFNTESPSVTVITFRYTLTGTNAVTMTLTNIGSENRTLHLYALTNERLPGSPVLTPVAPGVLALASAGGAPLTVSAALADNANPVNLVKEGAGELRLSGPVDTTGTIALLADGLVIDVPSGLTRELAAMPYPRLTGSGGFTKAGDGALTVYGANDHSGPTTVAQGTLRIGGGSPLGSGDVTVLDGAALDIGGDAGTPNATGVRKYMLDGPRTVTIRGAGPDGNGAYVNNSLFNQRYSTTGVALSGDATVGSTAVVPALNEMVGSISVLAQGGTFTLNGHTLTKKSDNLLSMGNGIIDTTGGGTFDILQGTFRLHDTENGNIASTFLGDDTTTVNLAGGTRFLLDNFNPTTPCPWSFNLGNDARLYAGGRPATLTGPVTLAGNVIVDGATDLTLSGPLSGSGNILKAGSGNLTLSFADNTYQGDTTISAAAVRVGATNALSSTGTVTANMAKLEVIYGGRQELPSLLLFGSGLTGWGNWGKSGDVAVNGTTTVESMEFMPFAGVNARHFETGALVLNGGFIASDTLAFGTLEKTTAAATLAASNINVETLTVTGGRLTLDELSIEDVFRIGRPLVWYDASDAASIVTNAEGFVTLFRNKGISANADAVPDPATTAASNTFSVATAPDGLTFIRKDTDPYAALMSNADIGITGTAPRTLFAAARRILPDKGLQIHYGPNANGQAFAFDIGTANIYYYLYSNDIQVGNSVAAGEPLVLTHMSGGEGNAMLRQAWLNGVYMGEKSDGTFNTVNNRFRLFARAGQNALQGDIGEVLFFNRTLSDAERRAVERYLSRKWHSADTPALPPALAPGTDVALVPTPQQDAAASIAFPFDDTTCGISTNKRYTHALDFGNNTAAANVVNGVPFTPIAGNDAQAGVSLVYNNRANNNTINTQILPWCVFRTLLPNMMYSNSGNPTAVTLSGLTPGKAYEIALINRPWSSDGNFTNRRMTVNFINGTARDLLTFNNECSLVQILNWRYVAQGESVTVTLINTTTSLTLHLYALTNEELPPTAADGNDLLPLLDLGSRPETIRNLTGSGTVTGDGAVALTVTGEITTPSVINFDGAKPVFDGAVFRAAPDCGRVHVVGEADFSALTVAAVPGIVNPRSMRRMILSATGGVTALPALHPELRATNRLELSGDGNSVWIAPVIGTAIILK
ncbi:MAG: autotransporter-associated beta strand repeat-containing protein [Kiritimatiellaeota bacterium]|nr:autotransporter-associated beta strand repeat-containing protein [Kiritimatiellota bacterium]